MMGWRLGGVGGNDVNGSEECKKMRMAPINQSLLHVDAMWSSPFWFDIDVWLKSFKFLDRQPRHGLVIVILNLKKMRRVWPINFWGRIATIIRNGWSKTENIQSSRRQWEDTVAIVRSRFSLCKLSEQFSFCMWCAFQSVKYSFWL